MLDVRSYCFKRLHDTLRHKRLDYTLRHKRITYGPGFGMVVLIVQVLGFVWLDQATYTRIIGVVGLLMPCTWGPVFLGTSLWYSIVVCGCIHTF